MVTVAGVVPPLAGRLPTVAASHGESEETVNGMAVLAVTDTLWVSEAELPVEEEKVKAVELSCNPFGFDPDTTSVTGMAGRADPPCGVMMSEVVYVPAARPPGLTLIASGTPLVVACPEVKFNESQFTTGFSDTLNGIVGLSAHDAVQHAFDVFGIDSPSNHTRSGLEAWLTAQRADSNAWTHWSFINLLTLVMLSPEMSLA